MSTTESILTRIESTRNGKNLDQVKIAFYVF